MGPLLPLGIMVLTGGAFWASGNRDQLKGKNTPHRQHVFETALNEVKEPEKLRALAKAFRDQGLNAQADLLEKRARLRELPADVKAERREAFRKGMNSKDANAVLTLAEAFDREGATGAANALRNYASQLNAEKAKEAADTTAKLHGE